MAAFNLALRIPMAIYSLEDRVPEIHPSAFVHEDATVIGSVVMAENSSIWPQVTARGDTAPLTIGKGSNVQDGSVLHADMDTPLIIGENVTVGHQVMLHGCTIGDGSLIGIQSVILNNAVIGRNCLVGAGSVVTEGKVFPDNSLILGSPARVVRQLSPEQIAGMQKSAPAYAANALRHKTKTRRIG